MVMCDYFSASDDDVAVRVLDQPGGPDPSVFDVVPLKGIDPVVVTAQLEAILTGCTYDQASERPRAGRVLESPPTPRSRYSSCFPGWPAAHVRRGCACSAGGLFEPLLVSGGGPA